MMNNYKNNSTKKYIITAALPYANGPIHIGHMAGVYLPSDIYARYMRLRGYDVLFISGSDEHGVPITIRADKEGIASQKVVDRYHQLNKDSLEKFGISFDIFSRTTLDIHHDTALDFFNVLKEKKVLTQHTEEQFYDEVKHQFLSDRYIIGKCPKCNYNAAYGDQCEYCGATLSPHDLIEPRSTLSNTKPVLKPTTHWYLPLDKYSDWLKEWIFNEKTHWRHNVYGQCKSWLDQGLHKRAITRDLSWGVSLNDGSGKVLYVWFEAPVGYITATKQWAKENNKNWEDYWKNSYNKLIHFLGKDNIVFHCIIFPVMLKEYGGYILPDNVVANEFLNLEGKKISTSRDWAVWLPEYLERFPDKQDVLRYVLCANAPETKDSDFTWKDFQLRNNSELVAIAGNFIHRTLTLISRYYNCQVPEKGPLEELGEVDNVFITKLLQCKLNIEESIEKFQFRKALSYWLEIARLGNKYLADTEPWKADPSRQATVLYIAVNSIVHLGVLGMPFLPLSSDKIFSLLKIENFMWDDCNSIDLLPVEHLLSKPEIIFENISDDIIDTEISRLCK